MKDEHALIEDIKTELNPIKGFLQVIYLNDEIVHHGIGLKPGISFNDLSDFGYIPEETTKKQFIKLLDWFNNNLKAFDIALKELNGGC